MNTTENSKAVTPSGSSILPAALVCLCALILRSWDLPDLWINPDEGIYFQTATKANPIDVLKATAAHAHPPLYYLLLWAFASISTEIIWLRLPSILFGLISVWGMYSLGSFLFSRSSAVIMSLLWAISPAAIISSQTMRPYPMLLALMPFMLLGFCQMVRSENFRDSRLFSFLLASLLLVHYGGFVVFFGTTLALIGIALLAPGRRQRLGGLLNAYWIPSFSLFIVCSINLQFLFSQGMIRSLRQSDWLIPMYADSFSNFALNFAGWIGYLSEGSAILVVSIVSLVGIVRLFFSHRDICILFCSVLLFTFGLSLLSLYPFGGSRHSFYLAPFLIIFTGATIELVLRSRALLITSLILLTLFASVGNHFHSFLNSKQTPIVLHPPHWEQIVSKSDIQSIVAALKNLQPGRIIAMDQQTFHLLVPVFRGAFEGGSLNEQHAISVLSPYRFDSYKALMKGVEEEVRSSALEATEVILVLSGWGRSSILDEITNISNKDEALSILRRANNLLILKVRLTQKAQ